jgi:hypothetical protein
VFCSGSRITGRLPQRKGLKGSHDGIDSRLLSVMHIVDNMKKHEDEQGEDSLIGQEHANRL